MTAPINPRIEPWCREGCMHALHGEDDAPMRNTDKDPRIEAVAKLLFTGPLSNRMPEYWDAPWQEERRGVCLMAAEDVLRGIDEAGEWVYGWLHPGDPVGNTVPCLTEEEARECARIVEGTVLRTRPFGWEPLPKPPTT